MATMRPALGQPEKNPFDHDIEYLIYSSHKTGTQSLSATLNHSGFKASHLHLLRNIGLATDRGLLQGLLDDYCRKNNKPLIILSTFRLPLERHISSFFQWHGVGVLRCGLLESSQETILARCSLHELQKIFISQLSDNSLAGYKESLHEICHELSIPIRYLSYQEDCGFGCLESCNIRLITFRFDQLFGYFPELLENALGQKMIAQENNLSSDQWYQKILREFKVSLRLPADLIRKIHDEKRDLINLFYPGRYELIVEASLHRYRQ